MHTPTICYPLAMRLLDHGHGTRHIQAELRYSVADPLAVTVIFDPSGRRPVPWIFARDLLTAGLDHPAGGGDIDVWPATDPSRSPTVRIRLHSPDGKALLETAAPPVEEFLAKTWSLVPSNMESRLLRIDRWLDSFLDRA